MEQKPQFLLWGFVNGNLARVFNLIYTLIISLNTESLSPE